MSDHKQHITYSATDIQRYLQGKLSPADMHAMEKAALDDPFLADAIEGMQIALQEHDVNTINSQLKQAQEQFQQRVNPVKAAKLAAPAKVVAFHWWQAAAAAAVIIVGGLWIYNLSNKESKAPLTVAQTKTTVEAHENEVSTQLATDSVVATVTPPARPQKTENKVTRKPNIPLPEASAPVVAVEKAKTDTTLSNLAISTPTKEDVIRDVLASRQAPTNQAVPPASAPKQYNDLNNRPTELITIAKNHSRAKQTVMSDKALTGVVKGIVTDPFKNPVANAYVSYPGTNNRYDILTDKTGHFNIPTNDSVVDVTVNVVGYGIQNFRLQNNASLNELQLQPATNNLDEAVFTSLGKKGGGKYRSNSPKVVQHDAEPVYGWLAYEQYLEKNKIRPAGFENTTGTVTVSFFVNRKGELSDFKIEKSLAKQLDDEAIRLIAQGPAWKLLKGRKARTTVIVKF